MIRGALRTRSPSSLGGTRRRLHHAVQRFPHIAGDAERQAGDDGAAGEHVRIGREHHRRHGAAGGKPGHEDAPRNRFCDRRPSARSSAGSKQASPRPRAVSSGLNQLKQVLALFDACCSRHQQRKAVALRQRRPAGAEIVAGRGLAAAMQHDDQRRRALKVFRYEREHPNAPGLEPNPLTSTSGLAATGEKPRP